MSDANRSRLLRATFVALDALCSGRLRLDDIAPIVSALSGAVATDDLTWWLRYTDLRAHADQAGEESRAELIFSQAIVQALLPWLMDEPRQAA